MTAPSMTSTESNLFTAMAGDLVLRFGDVHAGLYEALNRMAQERAKVGDA
ncbi:hypothetical protein [Solilutibacter silvestris]|uniref:Uncharacterized protein n=1 Tax=Solilutibacter silvestris TaxID=1645665 RepID=A0A2K1PYG2_9GAMM|nr:hypothetical protein [Lysobacter silvestris]PNS07832.1 hypothetical protein Lysil_2008 [Lysobacter silvestris]